MATKTVKKKAAKKVAKPDKKGYFTTKELAAHEEVTEKTVYKWIKLGRIKAVRASEVPNAGRHHARGWLIPRSTYKRPYGWKPTGDV